MTFLALLGRVLAADWWPSTEPAPQWLCGHWLAMAYRARDVSRSSDDPLVRAAAHAEAGRYYAWLAAVGAVEDRHRHALNSAMMHTYTRGAVYQATVDRAEDRLEMELLR